ncbi:Probable low-affinity inorganic phosphate transporter [hydrothermal vent metagenome]|uniref:Probable low-affinity inorganic phosphate transporter n=1 Tax=hydrothermal vent metagenome TaxID=652676 RepID=A0A3B0S229_9ZZZZ
MTMDVMLVILAGIAIAWANGSNDVSKGIATLVGAGMTNYRTAILWGTFFTFAGAMTGAFFAHAMTETFGGKLLTAAASPDMVSALAIIGGAAAWVLLATRTGLPVSTTHAIVGSLLGVALVAFGSEGVAWNKLIWKVALPLSLSPLVALAATMLLRRLWTLWKASGKAADDCICVTVEPQVAFVQGGATAAPALAISTCDTQSTEAVPANALITVDKLHWLSAGLTSFARGMNDAPKLAGLMIAAALLSDTAQTANLTAFLVVAGAMTVGGLMAGLRVTRMLAEKVTVMNHHEGFTANIVTSMLVSAGAIFGLPMSTTHVSASALIGVGVSGQKGNLHMGAVKVMLAAWVITLPGAAAFGIILFWLGWFMQA